jgi:hypothetical protein
VRAPGRVCLSATQWPGILDRRKSWYEYALDVTMGSNKHTYTAVATATALLVTVVVAQSGCRRSVSKQERASLRAQAEEMDAPRRRALAEIIAGRSTRLLPDPCPAQVVPEAWRAWSALSAVPKDWQNVAAVGKQWSARNRIGVWHPAMRSAIVRGIGLDGGVDATDIVFAGPSYREAIADLDNEGSPVRWAAGDLSVPSGKNVSAAVAKFFGDVDATLVLFGEGISFAVQNRINLAPLRGMLWVWSYREQAFVCAGEARIPGATLNGVFHDDQATIVRDSLRMRAVAQAIGTLRSVEPLR